MAKPALEATSSPPVHSTVTASVSTSCEYAELLAKYEMEFSHRYTDSDPNFQAYLSKEGDPPPIVENFNARPANREDSRNYNRGFKRRYDDRQREDGYQRPDRYRSQPDYRSSDRRPQDQYHRNCDRGPQFNRPWQDNRPQQDDRSWQNNRSWKYSRQLRDDRGPHDRHQSKYGSDQRQRDWQHQQSSDRHSGNNDWT